MGGSVPAPPRAPVTRPSPPPVALSPATFERVVVGWADGEGGGPLYRRLAAAVLDAVDRGDVPRASRLPAERGAARALGVSRGTVVAAYDLLAEAGLVDRRPGSGTWVGDGSAPELRLHELAAGLRARQLTRQTLAPDAVVDLALSVLPTPDDLPPEALQLDPDELSRLAHGHGYHPSGLPALRERLAAVHTDLGLPTRADQIVVTLGAQQAIALTARLLVRPGDAVAVESPTYPGAIDVYSRAGARFVTVAGDSAGVDPDDLARAMAGTGARVAYVVPTGHNPRGTVLPDQRRRRVAAVVDAADRWLVEDECLAWCTHGGDGPPRPVAAYGFSRSARSRSWPGVACGSGGCAPRPALRPGSGDSSARSTSATARCPRSWPCPCSTTSTSSQPPAGATWRRTRRCCAGCWPRRCPAGGCGPLTPACRCGYGCPPGRATRSRRWRSATASGCCPAARPARTTPTSTTCG
jgi:DNA-binding transcriptional regulator YhcF (GntR family)